MKKLLFLIIVTTIAISCSKNDATIPAESSKKLIFYEATGTITGPDLALCPSCGGWKLIINNVVLPMNLLPDVFRFDNLPSNSNINLSTATFPLAVKFNYSNNPNACAGSHYQIVIDDIALN